MGFQIESIKRINSLRNSEIEGKFLGVSNKLCLFLLNVNCHGRIFIALTVGYSATLLWTTTDVSQFLGRKGWNPTKLAAFRDHLSLRQKSDFELTERSMRCIPRRAPVWGLCQAVIDGRCCAGKLVAFASCIIPEPLFSTPITMAIVASSQEGTL